VPPPASASGRDGGTGWVRGLLGNGDGTHRGGPVTSDPPGGPGETAGPGRFGDWFVPPPPVPRPPG